MTFRIGAIQLVSWKQKHNTRSSTELELVGVDDVADLILWMKLFMEAQGYEVKKNILYQDNKSAILLEKNGKMSSGKRTKHVDVRHFFIADRVAKGEVKIEWCPTGEMVGDCAAKPLQGALFKRFRDLVMGVVPVNNSKPDEWILVCNGKKKTKDSEKTKDGQKSLVPRDAGPQECVGGSGNHGQRRAGSDSGTPGTAVGRKLPKTGIKLRKVIHHGEEGSDHGKRRLQDRNGRSLKTFARH